MKSTKAEKIISKTKAKTNEIIDKVADVISTRLSINKTISEPAACIATGIGYAAVIISIYNIFTQIALVVGLGLAVGAVLFLTRNKTKEDADET